MEVFMLLYTPRTEWMDFHIKEATNFKISLNLTKYPMHGVK